MNEPIVLQAIEEGFIYDDSIADATHFEARDRATIQDKKPKPEPKKRSRKKKEEKEQYDQQKREEELAKTLYEKPIAVQLDTILSIKQRPTSNWKEGKVTF